MKILLTGITGFIGSHLAESLLNEGNELHAIVRKSSRINELSENLQDNVTFHVYDEKHTILDLITDLSLNHFHF